MNILEVDPDVESIERWDVWEVAASVDVVDVAEEGQMRKEVEVGEAVGGVEAEVVGVDVADDAADVDVVGADLADDERDDGNEVDVVAAAHSDSIQNLQG
jgi:hypothetical protein